MAERPGRWWGVLAAALVLGLGARALLPWALEHVAARQLADALDARVALEDVDVSLLSGSVTVEALSLAPSEAPEPALLRVARVEAHLDRAALLAGRLGLRGLLVEDAELVLDRTPDGGLEWSVQGFPGSGAGEAPDAAPTELRLGRVELRDVRLRLRSDGAEEARLGLAEGSVDEIEILGGPAGWRVARLALSGLRLELATEGEEPLAISGGLSAEGLAPGAEEPATFELALRQGDARLEGTGSVSLATGAALLDLEWQELSGPLLLPRLLPQVRQAIDLRRGRFAGSARLAVEPASSEAAAGENDGPRPGSLRIEGRASARDVDLRLPEARIEAAWQELAVEVEEARFPLAGDGRPELRLKALRSRSPVVRVTLSEVGEETAASPAPAPGAAVPRLRIAEVELEDGLATLVDPGAEDAELAFGDLQLRAAGLRLPELQAERLALEAAGPGGAPLRVSGRVGAQGGALELRGERLDLLALAPLVAARTDYRIVAGAASFDASVQLEPERYVAPARLDLHALRIETGDEGRGFRQRFGMPPALALALLRDARGDISLELPMEGSRGEARVRLGPVLADALSDALVNALAKPLALLGSVVLEEGRIQAYDLSPVRFVPGGSEPATAADAQIGRAAGLLAAHPALRLELVPLVVQPDARSLAEAAGTPASPEALRALAARRAAAVRDALLAGGGVEPGRVAVRAGPLALGAGAPRVELVLGAAEPEPLGEAP